DRWQRTVADGTVQHRAARGVPDPHRRGASDRYALPGGPRGATRRRATGDRRDADAHPGARDVPPLTGGARSPLRPARRGPRRRSAARRRRRSHRLRGDPEPGAPSGAPGNARRRRASHEAGHRSRRARQRAPRRARVSARARGFRAIVLAALFVAVAAGVADARKYAWLGVRIRDLSEQEMDDLAKKHGIREGFGVVIVEVMEGTPAQTAGM